MDGSGLGVPSRAAALRKGTSFAPFGGLDSIRLLGQLESDLFRVIYSGRYGAFLDPASGSRPGHRRPSFLDGGSGRSRFLLR